MHREKQIDPGEGRLISATSQGCLVAINILHLNQRLPFSFIGVYLSFFSSTGIYISFLPRRSSLRLGMILVDCVRFKQLNFFGSNESRAGNAYQYIWLTALHL